MFSLSNAAILHIQHGLATLTPESINTFQVEAENVIPYLHHTPRPVYHHFILSQRRKIREPNQLKLFDTLLSASLKLSLRSPDFITVIIRTFEHQSLQKEISSRNSLEEFCSSLQFTQNDFLLLVVALTYSTVSDHRMIAEDVLFSYLHEQQYHLSHLTHRTRHVIFYTLKMKALLSSENTYWNTQNLAALNQGQIQMQTSVVLSSITTALFSRNCVNPHVIYRGLCMNRPSIFRSRDSQRQWKMNTRPTRAIIDFTRTSLPTSHLLLDFGQTIFSSAEQKAISLTQLIIGYTGQQEENSLLNVLGRIVGTIVMDIQDRVLSHPNVVTNDSKRSVDNTQIQPHVKRIIKMWNLPLFGQIVSTLFPKISADSIVRALDYPGFECKHPVGVFALQLFYSSFVKHRTRIHSPKPDRIPDFQFPYHVLFTARMSDQEEHPGAFNLWTNRCAQFSLIQCALQCSEEVFSFEEMSHPSYSQVFEGHSPFTIISDIAQPSIISFYAKKGINRKDTNLRHDLPPSRKGKPEYTHHLIQRLPTSLPLPTLTDLNQPQPASVPIYPNPLFPITSRDFSRVLSAFRVVDVTLTLLALCTPNTSSVQGGSVPPRLLSSVLACFSLPAALIPDFMILILSMIFHLTPSINLPFFLAMASLPYSVILRSRPSAQILLDSMKKTEQSKSLLHISKSLTLPSLIPTALSILTMITLHKFDQSWSTYIVDVLSASQTIDKILQLLVLSPETQPINGFVFSVPVSFGMDVAHLAKCRNLLNLEYWLPDFHKHLPTKPSIKSSLTRQIFLFELVVYIHSKLVRTPPPLSSLISFFSPAFVVNKTHPLFLPVHPQIFEYFNQYVLKNIELFSTPTFQQLTKSLNNAGRYEDPDLDVLDLVSLQHSMTTLRNVMLDNPQHTRRRLNGIRGKSPSHVPFSFYSVTIDPNGESVIPSSSYGFQLQSHLSFSAQSAVAATIVPQTVSQYTIHNPSENPSPLPHDTHQIQNAVNTLFLKYFQGVIDVAEVIKQCQDWILTKKKEHHDYFVGHLFKELEHYEGFSHDYLERYVNLVRNCLKAEIFTEQQARTFKKLVEDALTSRNPQMRDIGTIFVRQLDELNAQTQGTVNPSQSQLSTRRIRPEQCEGSFMERCASARMSNTKMLFISFHSEQIYLPSYSFQTSLNSFFLRLHRLNSQASVGQDFIDDFLNLIESEIVTIRANGTVLPHPASVLTNVQIEMLSRVIYPFVSKFLLFKYILSRPEDHNTDPDSKDQIDPNTSIENFVAFLHKMDSPSLSNQVQKDIRQTLNCFADLDHVTTSLVKSDEFTKTLKTLGQLYGLLTIAVNLPIRKIQFSTLFDVKTFLLVGFQKGRLWAHIPFVCALLQSCTRSTVFNPQQPWIAGILSLLSELGSLPLKDSIKFDIHTLKHELEKFFRPIKGVDYVLPQPEDAQALIQSHPMLVAPEMNIDLDLHTSHRRKASSEASFSQSMNQIKFGYDPPKLDLSKINFSQNVAFKEFVETKYRPKLENIINMARAESKETVTAVLTQTFLRDGYFLPIDTDTRVQEQDPFEGWFYAMSRVQCFSLLTHVAYYAIRKNLWAGLGKLLDGMKTEGKQLLIAQISSDSKVSLPPPSTMKSILEILLPQMVKYYFQPFFEDTLSVNEAIIKDVCQIFARNRAMTRVLFFKSNLIQPSYFFDTESFSFIWYSLISTKLLPDWTDPTLNLTLTQIFAILFKRTAAFLESVSISQTTPLLKSFSIDPILTIDPRYFSLPSLIPQPPSIKKMLHMKPPDRFLSTSIIKPAIIEKHVQLIEDEFKIEEISFYRESSAFDREVRALREAALDRMIIKNECHAIEQYLFHKLDAQSLTFLPHQHLPRILAPETCRDLVYPIYMKHRDTKTVEVERDQEKFTLSVNHQVNGFRVRLRHLTSRIQQEARKKVMTITKEFLKVVQENEMYISFFLLNEYTRLLSECQSKFVRILTTACVHKMMADVSPFLMVIPHVNSPISPHPPAGTRCHEIPAFIHTSPQITSIQSLSKAQENVAPFSPQDPRLEYPRESSVVITDSYYMKMLVMLHSLDPATVMQVVFETCLREGLGMASHPPPAGLEKDDSVALQYQTPPTTVVGKVKRSNTQDQDVILAHHLTLSFHQKNQWICSKHIHQISVLIHLILEGLLAARLYFENLQHVFHRIWRSTFPRDTDGTKPQFRINVAWTDCLLNGLMFVNLLLRFIAEQPQEIHVLNVGEFFQCLVNAIDDWKEMAASPAFMQEFNTLNTSISQYKRYWEIFEGTFFEIAQLVDLLIEKNIKFGRDTRRFHLFESLQEQINSTPTPPINEDPILVPKDEDILTLFEEWSQNKQNNGQDLGIVAKFNSINALSMISPPSNPEVYPPLFNTFCVAFAHTLSTFADTERLTRQEVIKDPIVSTFLDQQVSILDEANPLKSISTSSRKDKKEEAERGSYTSEVSVPSTHTSSSSLNSLVLHYNLSASDLFCHFVLLVCNVISAAHHQQNQDSPNLPFAPYSSPAFLSTLSLALESVISCTLSSQPPNSNILHHTHRIIYVLQARVFGSIPAYSDVVSLSTLDPERGVEIVERIEILENWYLTLFANTLSRLSPVQFPAFSYQFLSLLSSTHILKRLGSVHTPFQKDPSMPSSETSPDSPPQNWIHFRALLIPLLQLNSLISSHKHSKPMSSFSSGLFRLFVVLKTNFPDFLSFAAPSLLTCSTNHKKLYNLLSSFVH
ncbi:hypothetical protein BLNAU_2662 [Blattamonas nauphoetae]|uniref:CCR4-NOT transcription complex subunit 1 n=1 Tax=Blattamonas nauphoetae TaxID=2049346 RepID=A0ABQ9YFR1_9EUKA|nr:hypothetical protein BLNAU_2662 [Blattamonas nauphoetae]